MSPRLPLVLTALALAATLPAPAAQSVRTGTAIQIDYSNAGTWNYSSTGRGFRAAPSGSGTMCDWTYPGSPFQSITFEYSIGSTAYRYSGTISSQNYTRVSQSYTNSGGVTTVTDVWRGTGIDSTTPWSPKSRPRAAPFPRGVYPTIVYASPIAAAWR